MLSVNRCYAVAVRVLIDFLHLRSEFIAIPRRAEARRWRGLYAGALMAHSLAAGGSLVTSPPANALGTGTKGWCTVVGVGTASCGHSSALSACYTQWGVYAAPNKFYGATPTGAWYQAQCDWFRPGVPGPTVVTFECDSGYVRNPSGTCVADPQNFQFASGSKDNSCGAYNGGASLSPHTSGPINLANGAKTFIVLDYRTADGSLELKRFYNSLSYGGTQETYRPVPGLGQNWRLSFQHEIHLDDNFNGRAELQWADGGSYLFTKNNAGVMEVSQPLYSTKQTDFTLEFVGTWPSPVNSVLTATSQWRARDADDNVWIFDTFLEPATGKYAIGHPTSVTFRGGLQWTFTYGSDNELTTITDSFGKQITFAWLIQDPTASGASFARTPIAISSATLPDGTSLKYIYDATAGAIPDFDTSDRLIKVERRDASNALVDATTYLYENTDFPFNVTGIKDAANTRRWTVEYDAYGHAITSKGPSDADKNTVSYSSVAYPSFTRTVTNALGKQTVYSWHWENNDVYLTGISGTASTNCPSSTVSLTYTGGSTRQISSTTDEEGRVTNYTRESRGLPTQIIDGYGTASARTTNYTWHSTFRVPTQIVQPGLTTDLTWNTSGQLTQLTQTDTTSHSVPYSTNGQTRTWAYTYTTGGRLATVDGPFSGTGDTVTYTYNSDGYLQTVTDEVGNVTTFTAWNGSGQPTAMTDANSVNATLAYDGLDRLTSITVDPSGPAAATSFEYNNVGQITKITRPNGAFLEYTYDDGKRLIKVEDNTGAYVEYDRNELGNVTARRIKNSGGSTLLSQTATFDELGRLLNFVGASSQTWAHAHDKTSNLVSVTDPRSNVFQRTFDSINRLKTETDENSAVVTLSYNGKDDVTNYSDPRSLSTSYVRNGFGEAIQRTSPDTGTTVYEYNALGKTTKITDARSIVTNLTYDNAGRLLTKTFPASTGENITLTWDSTASDNKGKGRLTKIQDASGTVEWFYNALGHVTQEKKTTASIVYTVDYQSDLDGNVTQMTYPSGRIVIFSRDSTGRISGVTTKKDSGSSTVTLASSVTYAPFGALKSLTHGNSLVLTKTFTQDYLIDALQVQDTGTSTTVIDRAHAFGDDINLTGITDNVTSGRSETYGYTNANRLNSAAGIWGSLAWSYDSVGNRTSEALTSGSTTTWTYAYPGTNNKLSTITQGSNVRTFTHDGAGNVTADDRVGTTYNYRYNNRGRLDRLTIGSTVTGDYTYDGLERLAIRATQNMTPAGTTHYVYDLSGHLIAESTDAGQTVREYVWLDDTPIAVVADVDTMSPKLWHVHADHLDRPLRMTDGSQAVVWDAVYRPFGEVVSISGTASNNLRFPGQYFLIEAGLHYNWHRHYDPTIGRYVQADPLEFIDGASVYAYAKSASTQYVDPSGRFIAPVLVGFAVGASLGAGVDLGFQLLANNGNFGCVRLGQLGSAALFGGLFGGASGLAVQLALRGTAAVGGGRALADASAAAFRAAKSADEFAVGAKHLAGAGGNWSKFASGTNPNALIREALTSQGAKFLPNNAAGAFRLESNLGRVVGTKGETSVRVVVGNSGNIWTAFPIK